MQSQKQVWNNIAQEWENFKSEKPSKNTIEFLKNKTGNILDLGCGSGRHLQKIKSGKMFLVDFSEKMLKIARKKAKNKKIKADFIETELYNLPFKNNFFDSVICMHSLYCIKNPKLREKTLKEIYRVLKPKAKLLISVWDKNSNRFKKDKKEKYVKWQNKGLRYYYLFDKEELQRLLEKAGFKIINKINSNVNLTFIAKK